MVSTPVDIGGGYSILPTGGASGSITVQDSSGAPSYTGITILQFKTADGFTLSNPVAGTARVGFSGSSSGATFLSVAKWGF